MFPVVFLVFFFQTDLNKSRMWGSISYKKVKNAKVQSDVQMRRKCDANANCGQLICANAMQIPNCTTSTGGCYKLFFCGLGSGCPTKLFLQGVRFFGTN
jgi:hypothetical protein